MSSACLKERGEAALPLRERACILAQDCAVSEWSDWSVIQEGCVDNAGNVSNIFIITGTLFVITVMAKLLLHYTGFIRIKSFIPSLDKF